MNGGEKVIVSLTSFPAAIKYVVPTVKSLLAGSVLPDKVVLYLTLSQFDESLQLADGKASAALQFSKEKALVPESLKEILPEELVRLAEENPIFEIRNYDNEIRSYRKLIPALKDFPDAVIVTVDDDVHYHPNMLKSLLELHRKYPTHILAHRAKRMKLGKPYKSWSKYRWYHFLFKKYHPRLDNLFTGVGGVLYPPGALKKDMLDERLFTKLAPTTDDIWFWAAAVANGTQIMPVPFGYNKPKGLGKPKAISLKTYNFKSGVDRNSAAMEAVLEAYPSIKEKLTADQRNQ